MWTETIFLTAVGLICGLAVSAGIFALITSLGVIPRLAGKTSVAAYAAALENAVIAGGILGTVVALFPQIPLHFGNWFAALAGAASGVFTGCLAMALAEVLHVFPVLYRRMKLKEGLALLVFAFAAGKTAGALYYFMVLYP